MSAARAYGLIAQVITAVALTGALAVGLYVSWWGALATFGAYMLGGLMMRFEWAAVAVRS